MISEWFLNNQTHHSMLSFNALLLVKRSLLFYNNVAHLCCNWIRELLFGKSYICEHWYCKWYNMLDQHRCNVALLLLSALLCTLSTFNAWLMNSMGLSFGNGAHGWYAFLSGKISQGLFFLVPASISLFYLHEKQLRHELGSSVCGWSFICTQRENLQRGLGQSRSLRLM